MDLHGQSDDVSGLLRDLSMETGATPLSREHGLWLSVMQVGIADISKLGPRSSKRECSELRTWLGYPQNRVGSFLWLCDLFDFDGVARQQQLLGEVEKWLKMKTSPVG